MQSFFPGGTYNYDTNWGWTYSTTNNGVWINAAAGNSGDIGLVVNETTHTGYATIQDAVSAANDGDTIDVTAGTYDGFSVVGRSNLTIQGAGVGSTIISPSTLIDTGVGDKSDTDMHVSVFVNNSTGITLKGMTIQSTSADPVSSSVNNAIVFWNASSGTITNDAITGVYTVNGNQTGQGIAVDASSGTINLTVAYTTISGFQKNGIQAVDGNGVQGGATDTINLTVSHDIITGMGLTDKIAQNGVLVWNRGGGSVTAAIDHSTISNFGFADPNVATAAGVLAYDGGSISSIRNTSFSNNQINISSAGAATNNDIDATLNYWGSAAAPGASTLDGETGTITFSPWYTDSGMTTVGSTMVSSSGQASTTLPVEVTQSGTSGSVSVAVDIPANTIVTGTSGWDGTIAPPTATTTTVSVSGFDTTVAAAIAVGSSDSDLTFDRAVKLTFAGQTGKRVGWYNHAGIFTEITTTCADNTQATNDGLAAGGSCKFDTGTDMVVWTKHFSTFVAYTQTAVPVASSGGSSNGNGGNGPIVAAAVLPSTPANAQAATSVGEVLGAEAYQFANTLRVGSSGQDVLELQNVLIAGGFLDAKYNTGYFGGLTKAAVVKYQKAHGISPASGLVGPLTRGVLNGGSQQSTAEVTTATQTLTDAQVGAILNLLSSFGADQATITNVAHALGK